MTKQDVFEKISHALSEADKKKILEQQKVFFQISAHMSVGLWVRNMIISPNEKEVANLFLTDINMEDYDDLSDIILGEFYDYLSKGERIVNIRNVSQTEGM